MSILLQHDYVQKLLSAEPTVLHTTHPHGGLSDIRTSGAEPLVIPPLNTNIEFTLLPEFKLSEHKGLAALKLILPVNFNWRTGAKEKGKENLIVTPGNQMLCGSCWAIAAAGVISDNFVVSGLVDWYPNLSTTWILSCPETKQSQCQGGNPALTFQQIAQGVMVSNHCIDYSWCSENSRCNGKAIHHFDENKKEKNSSPPPENIKPVYENKKGKHIFNPGEGLSQFIPEQCGCYDGDAEFFAYKIANKSKHISIGFDDIKQANMTNLIQKHILQYGPVLGGFIVFENFMHGKFTKVKGGVYLENGTYDDNNKVTFSDKMTSAENYKGSHAVAIIGWGVEKDVVVDNNGKKMPIPYWYCRNSWTEKWGDGGYFKMAMYPHNKISQFDKIVNINTPKGKFQGGGMVLIRAFEKPQKKKFPAIMEEIVKSKIKSYYTHDPKDKNPDDGVVDDKHSGGEHGGGEHGNKILPIISYIVGIIILIVLAFFMKKILYLILLVVILSSLLFILK